MPKSGVRVFLATVAVVGTSASGAFDGDLSKQISELEKMVMSQQEELSTLEERKLQVLGGGLIGTPSIYGMYDLKHRAYSPEEDFHHASDSMFVILCGILAMFMQVGFAMLEAGACRVRNVQSVLLKNATDVCIGTLAWWIFGWSFAYSGPWQGEFKANSFIGYEEFVGHHFLTDVDDKGNIEPTDKMREWFFRWAFCMTATTIVSGGVMERATFWAYVIYSFVMTAFIFPLVVAWSWGKGFLAEAGYYDFAGSGIVHLAGGVGALVGAAIAGPRKGRFEGMTTVKQRFCEIPTDFAPHSQPLVVLGTLILWFGWYGMTAGSTMGVHDVASGAIAAQAAMNTTISAATCGLVVFIMRLILTKKYDLFAFCNGIISGLVAISAGCANVEAGSAMFIGFIAALVYLMFTVLERALKVDDPIDAFPVHAGCGLWGVLAAMLFDWGKGMQFVHGWSGLDCMRDATSGLCLTDEASRMFGANCLLILVVVAWVAILSVLVFLPLKMAKLLTPTDEVQDSGYDATKHGPVQAYATQLEEAPPALV